MVLQDEHLHRPPAKKSKAKKVPQRGLGVAQLEKLRIEEQQKNCMIPAASPSSHHPSPPSLLLPLPPPQQHHHVSSLAPFLSPPRDLRSTTINGGTSLPPPAMDYFKPEQIYSGFPAGRTDEIKYLSPLWGEEIRGLSAVDQYMSPIRLMSSKPALIPPSVSSGGDHHLQIEPPSNQNHSCCSSYSANSSSRREEEERIAGANLTWPFQPETAVSIPYKLPSFSPPFVRQPDEPPYSKIPWRFEHQNSHFRGETSSSDAHQVHSNKRLRENATASSDSFFLTLGSSSGAQSSSRPKQSQEGAVHVAKRPASSSSPSSQRAFFAFLPVGPSGCSEVEAKEQSCEGLDSVDTSLKL